MLVTVTLAPGTTAPAASSTVPVICPVAPCPKAAPAHVNTAARASDKKVSRLVENIIGDLPLQAPGRAGPGALTQNKNERPFSFPFLFAARACRGPRADSVVPRF